MKKYLVVLGLVLALTVVPLSAGAQSISDLQVLIAQLQAQIAALTAQLNQQTGSCKIIVAHDVAFGDEDTAADKTVTALQKYLERQGYLNMPVGANYGFFGRITLSAITAWQKANGVINNGTAETDTSGFAYVGRYSRSIINNCTTPIPVPTSITITSPNGGESWQKGSSQTISWRLSNPSNVSRVKLSLKKYRVPCTGLCPLDVEVAPYVIANNLSPASGQFVWTVGKGTDISGNPIQVESSQYWQVGACFDYPHEGGACDWSDSYFKITDSSTSQPSITVVSPNGGESWQLGTEKRIMWKWSGGNGYYGCDGLPNAGACASEPVTIRLIPDYSCPVGSACLTGAPDYLLTTIANLDYGGYPWKVGSVNNYGTTGSYLIKPDSYKIHICRPNNVCDLSDSYFKITDSTTTNKPPVITGLTAPSSLNIGQTGTWAVKAYDPEGGALSYNIIWGDEIDFGGILVGASAPKITSQNSTFTHSYSTTGTYKVAVTVSDTAGQSAQTTTTVQVGTISVSDYYISNISGQNSVYAASAPVNILVKGLDGDNTPASSAKGFNVQAYIFPASDTTFSGNYLPPNPPSSYNAAYDTSSGYWNVKMNAPSIADQYYNLRIVLYCSQTNSDCYSRYGHGDESVRVVGFKTTSSTPSLKSSLKVTVLNGGIQCIKAPCEFPLAGAQVALYDASKVLVGSQTVGSDGAANFSNLNLGTYTVYASASGYTKSNAYTVGLVSGQAGSIKIPVYPAPAASLTNDSQLAAVLQSLQTSLNLLKGVVGY